MLNVRVIPCLLLKEDVLVKTIKFKKQKYIGDPINAVKIFNEKEVDELVVLDISATNHKRKPNVKLIKEIASECFMPICYGGGIRNIDEVSEIFYLGIEKVSVNSYAVENPEFIRQISNKFGSQSVVVSMDVKKNFWGKYNVYANCGTINTKLDPITFAKLMEKMGAGEILLNSIDNDGTMSGYDLDLLKAISNEVEVPVIACGGAGDMTDFQKAVKHGGASAVAAGSYFVFHGPHRAVLINYPTQKEIHRTFNDCNGK